ncbi:radical SAM protein [Candidatus Woesearchaeota archaeon]|nr:MAG: radical SAM protein [Candidatus Woesearchaeota archaeon]
MLKSFSLFVGSSQCNANCKHCAGNILRKYAPKTDGIVDEELIAKTAVACYNEGARYLSLSSSGEPTLSPLAVTKTLEIINGLEGMEFYPINLYTNGIRIGSDEGFCKQYLPLWKNLGLTNFYVTVHSIDEKKNAEVYGVKQYPSLDIIINRVHAYGYKMRANIVLSKRTVSTFEQYVAMVEGLRLKGVDAVSAWVIRNDKDEPDTELSPLESELDKMSEWAKNQGPEIRLLREKHMEVYQKSEKLTLFPDGTLSNTWCGSTED